MDKKNAYDVLKERGYIAQVTDEAKVRELFDRGPVTFYIGFDPTADSLHVGHFLTMMVMSRLQQMGHRPIAILGGGTGMIGDPSGRQDMRQLMDMERVNQNVERFKKQMSILLDFSEGKALMLDNSEWILPLNYISFIREIGSQFSVNRMLTAECYKSRLETGLTFLEFNYMLLQANDFLQLYRKYHCTIQFGGDDQWSNILAGTDLIRRKEGGEAEGVTLKLLTKSDGTKMGKTSSGALWLDEKKCPVYDFYQYWRNIEDAKVIECMKLLTFMPLNEIESYAGLEGSEINEAKKRLAFEVSKIIHGEAKAREAERQAEEIFSGAGRSKNMPGIELTEADFGRQLLDILLEVKFLPSKGEGRRLIQQNGLYLNDEPVTDFGRSLVASDIHDGAAIVRKGKKNYFALKIKR